MELQRLFKNVHVTLLCGSGAKLGQGGLPKGDI